MPADQFLLLAYHQADVEDLSNSETVLVLLDWEWLHPCCPDIPKILILLLIPNLNLSEARKNTAETGRTQSFF